MNPTTIENTAGQWQWDGQEWRLTPTTALVVSTPSPGPPVQVQYVVAVQPAIRKDKVIAILLAIFLNFWTYLYTYKRDAGLFWLHLLLSVFTVGLWGIFVAWPWAIIHTCVRSDAYYERFPNV